MAEQQPISSSPPAAASDPSQEISLTPPVKHAAAALTVWGACRSHGDNYLVCVALKGKSECQSLRHLYEGCMRANISHGLQHLGQLSSKLTAAGSSSGSTDAAALERAAEAVLGPNHNS